MDGLPGTMRFGFAVMGLIGCGLAPRAEAQAPADFACVRCSGPEQTYRCHAMSEDTVPPAALRYFCMAQIAQDNVHESCAVLRNPGPCEGRDVSYVYQDRVGNLAVEGEDKPSAEQKPPTVADMTRATVDASVKAGKAVGEATVEAGKAVGEATVKAGKAVGDATKRTLECLGSALNNC